jgi:hypothetical protein
LDSVRVYDFLVSIALLVVVTTVVDELHLLENRGLEPSSDKCPPSVLTKGTHLAGLAGTEEEHFNLILGKHAVPLELVLDLVIAYEREVRAPHTGIYAGERGTYGPWPHRRRQKTVCNPWLRGESGGLMGGRIGWGWWGEPKKAKKPTRQSALSDE